MQSVSVCFVIVSIISLKLQYSRASVCAEPASVHTFDLSAAQYIAIPVTDNANLCIYFGGPIHAAPKSTPIISC